MQVILLPKVLEYLGELAVILYEKGYLGFEETASKYVMELYDDIIMNLPIHLHRPAPDYFDKYGKKYGVCRFQEKQAHAMARVFQGISKGWGSNLSSTLHRE